MKRNDDESQGLGLRLRWQQASPSTSPTWRFAPIEWGDADGDDGSSTEQTWRCAHE